MYSTKNAHVGTYSTKVHTLGHTVRTYALLDVQYDSAHFGMMQYGRVHFRAMRYGSVHFGMSLYESAHFGHCNTNVCTSGCCGTEMRTLSVETRNGTLWLENDSVHIV